MDKHTVRTFNWINNKLEYNDYTFNSYKKAIKFLCTTSYHGAKIKDSSGKVVYSIGVSDNNLYA